MGYGGMRIDVAIGMGFILETGIYCIYTCLFIAALPVMTNARRRRDPRSARSTWVFLIFSILMFLVATIHLVFAAFRFYKSMFSNPKEPMQYFRKSNHWEFLGLLILLCTQTWLGDALAIYQCYFVWNNNFWLILIPVCLLLGQIGTSAYILAWLRHPVFSAHTHIFRFRSAIYPLAFIQNFMTTSLIILKILLQHRASKKAGIVDVGSKLGLMRVVRILVESAALYTIQRLVLVVLYFCGNNFQYTIQAAVTPSIGITFVLLAIRTNASRSDYTTRNSCGVRNTLTPRWPHANNGSERGSVDHQDCNSLPAGSSDDIAEKKLDTQGESGGVDGNWGVESPSNSAESVKVSLSIE